MHQFVNHISLPAPGSLPIATPADTIHNLLLFLTTYLWKIYWYIAINRICIRSMQNMIFHIAVIWPLPQPAAIKLSIKYAWGQWQHTKCARYDCNNINPINHNNSASYVINHYQDLLIAQSCYCCSYTDQIRERCKKKGEKTNKC